MNSSSSVRCLRRRRARRSARSRAGRRRSAARRRRSRSASRTPAGCPSTCAFAMFASSRFACFVLAGLSQLARCMASMSMPRVPDVQVPHRRRTRASPRGRRAHRRESIVARARRVEAAVAAGHGEARHEPLHVPFERPRQRLVEVVDVNTSLRSGAAKAPKFDRCASPHSWAWSPVRGCPARSAAIRYAAPR